MASSDNIKRDVTPEDDNDTPVKRQKLDQELKPDAPGSSEVSKNTDHVTADEQGKKVEISRTRPVLAGLREKDVGITEYISKHEGFFGILKQRYRDFIVNEIDEAGNIVRLTDLSYPMPEGETPLDVDTVLSKEDQDKLAELMETEEKDEASHLIHVGVDKDQRTLIHTAVRQLYPHMESSTIDTEDGKKVIKVVKAKRGVKRRRSRWPKGRPDYTRFVLYKENMDCNEALGLVARYLHISPHNFGMAGNKDKRAVTAQEITCYRIEASRLGRLNDVLRGIRIGNFRYVKKALNLGELSGNHFVIILRNTQCPKKQLDDAMTSFKDDGFINYFGMQRFGNSVIASYMVGKALLLCDWSEAVELIIKPREGGSEKDDNKWREHWMKNKNAETALHMMPNFRRTSAEYQLLTGLDRVEPKDDPFKALLFIPRHVRLIYVHSYQSNIWNCILSRRLQKYGRKPIIGDLVLTGKQPAAEADHEEGGLAKTTYVTEDNISKYSIYDVVLPLPGYKIVYPKNEVGEWYKTRLADDGLDIDKMKHHVKDYSLGGDYRKILVRPSNVAWSMKQYSNFKLHLTQTDLDKLEGQDVPEQTDCTEQAIQMEFSLPSSTYATMAIREILKIDTSSLHQASLNEARSHQEPEKSAESESTESMKM